MYHYHTESVHYADGKGHRNIVNVSNNTGYKIKETLGKNGKTLKRTKHTLKKEEVRNIQNRKFMPGFWNTCGSKKKRNTA